MTKAVVPFNREFDPCPGMAVEIGPDIVRVSANNSGPYTFSGTNTYLVGNKSVVVIDPGPNDERHLGALIDAIKGRRVVAILLTHTHKDHCALARRLRQKTAAPLWFGGRHRLSRPKRFFEINKLKRASEWNLVPDRLLEDGEVLSIEHLQIEVVATPGHCANHLSFALAATPYIFTGDHVMGWNSTLVATPDGSMADYLDSLNRLIKAPFTHYFPGHGGAIKDLGPQSNGREFARSLLAHRRMRNRQIVEAVASGTTSMSGIVSRIYPGVGLKIRLAAGMIVQAHVEYLVAEGRLKLRRRFWGKTTLSLPDKSD